MKNNDSKFFPNSNWLYIKVYSGYKTAEKLLANEVFEFISNNNNLFEKFFFIRYFEEFPHIRFRFYNSDTSKNIDVQQKIIAVLENYINTDLIHKISIDTYQRETERYGGGNLIEHAETLFYTDSIACLSMLNLFTQIEEPEKYRILMALRSIDELLDDFKFDLEQKYQFSKRIQMSFFQEFGGHPQLQKQLNDKYRGYQKLIFSHLDKSKDEENQIEEAIEFYKIRSSQSQKAIFTILENVDKERLFELMGSYVHMLMNRMFLSQQRKFELVLYHFLEKYYNSQIAKEKYSKK
jgi:thiopeptide-type bacteriocin biosynthesis protein